ncbi:MAG TPA: amino acid adenylation domain-containing protein [Verrucomicrobiae bacterium]|jgi:amino acid adenylation domain-containing protein|nr:amino acid adenylation domain-containing protein [Verrucomicrobiae bacterium]
MSLASRPPAPLSFAQQQLWLVNRLRPGSPAYNMSRAFRLAGALDVGALESALTAIVARHEALRTTFHETDGEPVQMVGPPRPVEVTFVDLSAVPEDAREAALDAQLTGEVRRPFDLTSDLMLRALVARLGEREHAVLLVLHHIASDGWSMGVLVRELEAHYAAALTGDIAALPPLLVQYADHAAWQRARLVGARLADEIGYWRERLAGAPPALALPTDRPRPAELGDGGSQCTRLVPSALVSVVRALARAERVTLFAALLATFQTLLHRYTGETDLVVGTASACRILRDVEPLIGYFVNTLPLRMTLDGDPTFRDVLRHASRVSREALGHQELPFERLVAAIAPERRRDRSPIVQVTLVLHEASFAPATRLPGLTATPLRVRSGTAKFDLSLTALETAAGLQLTAEYSTDLFDASTIDRLLGHFTRLLEGAASDPDRRVSELPLLTADEVTCLESWSGASAVGAPAQPATACLHQLVAARAAASPDAVAVVAGSETLTYRQLEARADALARYLRVLGVGPDAPTGVYMGPSLDLPVALYAVLKAGGAYVPLDPALPAERLRFMLADAAASVVIADTALGSRLAEFGIRVVCPSTDVGEIGRAAEEPLDAGADPEALAYILYTSGSTGRPKGVMIPHRAIVNHMRWMADALPLTEADAVLQRTPIGFDASVWEFWAPLLAGARLIIGPAGAQRDPSELARVLAEHGITVLQLVPSLLRALLDEPALAEARALRRVCCGGEALTAELAERCLARLPVELINLYGPTEATIDATWWRCGRGEGSVPIGRPIGGMRAWVLDPAGQPVPPGVAGELHLGGVGLARGYLNRPELTAERFVPDPRSPEPGARLYRTGDRARWRADGVLEYLGRLDHQVKLRGMRVELGEVEAVLAGHPAVREAVVTVREDSGDGYLAAWVVLRPEARLDRETLRHFLAEQLPVTMIPRAVVTLDALPVTAHGKLDRAALPDPGEHDLLRAAVREAPATPLEQTLAHMWTELLGVTEIGRHDDFFAIGGHSLLAARLASRLRERLGVDVPLRLIFEAPVLADLAEAILESQLMDEVTFTEAAAAKEPTPAAAPTLRTLIETQARRAPEAAAIVAPGAAPLCYRDLLAQVDEVIEVLATWGLGRGDRIALVMPQGPELAVAFVAAALGATAVPLNPLYREGELERYLTAARASAVIVPPDRGPAARAVAARLGLPLLEIEPRPGPAGRFTLGPRLPVTPRPVDRPGPDDVALAIHTSGTTAGPKVVPLTHANMAAAIQGFVETFALRPDDRALGVMPLFHVQGLMVVLTSLAAGASVICTPAFDPIAVFDWIEATRPTWYSAVPTIHQAIVAEAPQHPTVMAGHVLRFIRSSAAPLPPAVMRELERHFGVPVIEGYGQSESCMLVTSNPLPPGERRTGSVGRPVTDEVTIVGEDGGLKRTGEVGEIQVRGKTVMAGYENDPAANAAAFRDGWYRTGDLGRFDPDGYLYVTGRIKEMINRGGEKVSPREVDDVLTAHHAVARAVTFPVPHPTLGEDVAAALVLRPGESVTEAEIRRFVSDHLAAFKVPRQLAIVDIIPLGATGKPDRRQLAAALARLKTANGPAPALTAIEAQVAKIWSEVLSRPVGVADDFVALGGDSLQAAVAAAHMADALGVTVPLDQFLETPTVAAVAARIAERLGPSAGDAR